MLGKGKHFLFLITHHPVTHQLGKSLVGDRGRILRRFIVFAINISCNHVASETIYEWIIVAIITIESFCFELIEIVIYASSSVKGIGRNV